MPVEDLADMRLVAPELVGQFLLRRSRSVRAAVRPFPKLPDAGNAHVGDDALAVILVVDVRPVAFSVSQIFGSCFP